MDQRDYRRSRSRSPPPRDAYGAPPPYRSADPGRMLPPPMPLSSSDRPGMRAGPRLPLFIANSRIHPEVKDMLAQHFATGQFTGESVGKSSVEMLENAPLNLALAVSAG